MRSKRIVAILALATVALLGPVTTGCKRRALADPLPASGQVNGWQKTSPTRAFAAKDLWQYIDGDAEQYVTAGVVSTTTSDYKYNGAIEAVVDVHRMKTAEGARRILARGKSAEGKPAPVGDEAVQYAQSLIFRKGATFVRIVSYQSTPETPQALLSLGQAIAEKL